MQLHSKVMFNRNFIGGRKECTKDHRQRQIRLDSVKWKRHQHGDAFRAFDVGWTAVKQI